MRIGVPKEIKVQEYRVGAQPAGVREFVRAGHEVLVETGAGAGSGFRDDDFAQAGATIVGSAADAWSADMVIKVKEPIASEYAYFRKDLILYTYLHLAPGAPQTQDLIKSGATCIAYETVTATGGGLPLLKPMSEVAGRMSVLAGAHYLQKATNGAGVLVSGVPGVAPANVVVIGGGVVGFNAAEMAVGLQANVTILDRNLLTLERINHHFGAQARAIFSTSAALASAARRVATSGDGERPRVARRTLWSAASASDPVGRFGVLECLDEAEGESLQLLAALLELHDRAVALLGDQLHVGHTRLPWMLSRANGTRIALKPF